MSESERSVNDSLEQVSEAPVDSFWEIGQYKVNIFFPRVIAESYYTYFLLNTYR